MLPANLLPRYAAMCGFLDERLVARDYRIYGCDEIEIPDEIVPKILALHFSERASNDLRVMGEGIGKLKIPSNINVWSHAKGEAQLAAAVNGLREAALAIAHQNNSVCA